MGYVEDDKTARLMLQGKAEIYDARVADVTKCQIYLTPRDSSVSSLSYANAATETMTLYKQIVF